MGKKPEAGSPEDASDFTRKMLLAKKAAGKTVELP